ncbi:hypothetical protein RUM43_005115 [Polyplax serrata]|uniref:Uncharacterized protein n=1 Tax=Polyplax serrata TaxID=468196 RepID=A0AAN8SBM8_POLSC
MLSDVKLKIKSDVIGCKSKDVKVLERRMKENKKSKTRIKLAFDWVESYYLIPIQVKIFQKRATKREQNERKNVNQKRGGREERNREIVREEEDTEKEGKRVNRKWNKKKIKFVSSENKRHEAVDILSLAIDIKRFQHFLPCHILPHVGPFDVSAAVANATFEANESKNQPVGAVLLFI